MADSPNQFELDFTKFEPSPEPTAAQAEALAPEVEIGNSQLQAFGFFVTVNRANRTRKSHSGKPLVLVIDDDESVREMLELHLGNDGYETRLAGNRGEIVEMLKLSPPPDLILCDVEMPDTDGFDLLNKLRQSKAFRDIPVLMLTARSEKKDVLRGIALGADGYIAKPAKFTTLQDAMSKLLA